MQGSTTLPADAMKRAFIKLQDRPQWHDGESLHGTENTLQKSIGNSWGSTIYSRCYCANRKTPLGRGRQPKKRASWIEGR